MTQVEAKDLLEELEREWGGVHVDASGREAGRVVLTPARTRHLGSEMPDDATAPQSDAWDTATDELNRRFWAIYDMFKVHGISVDPPLQPRPADMPVRTEP